MLRYACTACLVKYARNKNEQQDANSNVEFQTKWTKMIWKTCEATIRRARNRSIKA